MSENQQKHPKKAKTSKVAYHLKAQADLQYLAMSSDFFRCYHCKKKLGILHSMRYAIFKEQGATYNIPCKKCGCLNKRVKGALKGELEDRWKTVES